MSALTVIQLHDKCMAAYLSNVKHAEEWEDVLKFRVAELEKQAFRYEAVRRMNPRQFAELYAANIECGIPFDELVDHAATASTN